MPYDYGRLENPPYYLTAYGIAVKHGYKGTEEEWIHEIQESAHDSSIAAAASAASALQSKGVAEAFGAGTRGGEPLEEDDPAYHNNAQYYSANADTKAAAADDSAEDSEAYAIGKRSGVDVDSDDPAYHNNSKYYSDMAKDYAEDTGGLVTETVLGYLEETITNPDSPPLDRSLASSESAAPADIVGELKSALEQTASLTGVKWYNGYYDSNNTFVSTTTFKMSNIIPCMQGDTFIYHGISSQTNRKVVLFWNKNLELISSMSNIGPDYTEITITVPNNAEYMRVLAKTEDLYKTYIIYGGRADQHPLFENRKRIFILEEETSKTSSYFGFVANIGMTYGYITKDGVIINGGTGRKYTDLFLVPGGCQIRYKGESGHQNVNGISFYDASGNYISGNCNGGTNNTWVSVNVPENASLARISTIETIDFAVAFEVLSGNIFNSISKRLDANVVAFVSSTNGTDDVTADGSKIKPYKTIGYAISQGFRTICATPERYNENISLSGGEFELIPWVDEQTFSDAYRPKIKLIKGTKLTVSATSSTGIYQASYTAASGTNMYKVFVGKTVSPTSQGSLATEYNALLVEDMPDVSTPTKAAFPYQRQLYMPVLTETELSVEGTFWYDGTNNLVKFHAYGNTVAGEYYIPDDDAADGLKLEKMQKVHLEDVKVLGCYDSCIAVLNCDDATINACEFGYCAKGMGLRLDYANARVSDCHAYAISVDGFNLHGYGYSEIVDCTAFYCGDDGISHHQGCSGFVDGGEWAYCGSGGITPAFGCQVDVMNVYAHHNNIGIQWLGLDTCSRRTKMCNCLSIDNETDVYVLFYVVTAWNCVFRTKDSQYSGPRSKLTEYGTITPD